MEEDKFAVKPQTAATQNQDLQSIRLAQEDYNCHQQEAQRREPTPSNSRVFYGNVGREPYRVNHYVRPKGLSTFKLVKNPTEKEVDFERRKIVYYQEQDIIRQQGKLKSQFAAMRGSMLRDQQMRSSANYSRVDKRDSSKLETSSDLITPQDVALKHSAS